MTGLACARLRSGVGQAVQWLDGGLLKGTKVKVIEPTGGKVSWPRWKAPTVEARKRDLLVRVSNWMRDRDEPAYDVEVYIGGVYDWNESKSFTLSSGLSRKQCKAAAIEFASKQIARLL